MEINYERRCEELETKLNAQINATQLSKEQLKAIKIELEKANTDIKKANTNVADLQSKCEKLQNKIDSFKNLLQQRDILQKEINSFFN